jgi:outer membrane immunogenic protein
MKAPAASLWNGFYVGAGLSLRANDSGVTTTAAADAVVVGFSPTNTTNEPLDGTAFRGAPYIGWNWQIAPRWVAGVEGDVGVANQTTSLQGFGFSPGVPAFELAKVDSFALRTTWDASARARVGYLVTPATLLYATGGAAWQHFDVNSACVSAGCGGSTPIVVTDSLTKTGWTAGFGAETMLSGNWFARAEYRYAGFAPTSLTITRQFAGTPLFTNFDVAMRTHTATFGVSYKFGSLPLATN